MTAKRKVDSKLEKKLKKLRVGVRHRRRVTSIGNKDSIGYRFLLGYSFTGEKIQKRVGSCPLFAEELRNAWNLDVERKELAAGQNIAELSSPDTQKAIQLLRNHPTITLVDCVNFYLDKFGSPDSLITVGDAEEIYSKIQKEKGHGPTSWDINHTNWKTYFSPFFLKFKDKRLFEFSVEDAQAWFARSVCKKWSSATWQAHRTRLKSFWNTLAEENYCSKEINPFDRVRKKIIKKEKKNVMSATDVKAWFLWMEKLCQKKPQHYPELALMTVGFFCGVRVEEITRVGWSSINKRAKKLKKSPADFSGWSITVWADEEKMGETKVNPITENAKAWLRLCESNWKKKEVKSVVDDDSIAARDATQRMKRLRSEARKELGIEIDRNAARITFTTHHYAFFGDRDLTAKRLGHSETGNTIEKHYLGHANDADGESYFEIYPESQKKKVTAGKKYQLYQARKPLGFNL